MSAPVLAAVPDCAEIVFDTDNLLELNDALDASVTPNVPITGATVAATLTDISDPDNPSVLGISPISMPEFPSPPSDDYRATFFASAANSFFVGQRIEVGIDFDGGVGLRRQFTFIAIVCE